MRGTRKSGCGIPYASRLIRMLLALAAACALTACGGGGGSTASTALVVGFSTINLSGGDSATTGGSGGTFKAYSSARSDLKIHVGGTVDASFIAPTYTYNSGTNPATIGTAPVTSTNITVQVDPPTPSDGQLYMKTGSTSLFLGTGNAANDLPVTGLTVPAQMTITFPAPVTFSNTVAISGTVQPTTGQSLSLTAGSLVVNFGGRVISNGGALTLSTVSPTSAAGGVIINSGTIDSGTSAAGGSAGTLSVQAKTSLYNTSTGTITAKGSDNAGAAGGKGGAISLFAATASLLNSGTIDASGGSGATGGDANAIRLVAGESSTTPGQNDTNGKVAVGWYVKANGGNGSTGLGGKGGTITAVSHSLPLVVNAVISAVGGNGATNGGDGGQLVLQNLLASDPTTGINTSPQGIKVAGLISLNGGTGPQQGGAGGTLSVKSQASPNALPGSSTVEFFGYGLGINLNGGKGSLDGSTGGTGGTGGTFAATLVSAVTDNVKLPAGGVYNEVGITARGGDGGPVANPTSGTGGAGGTVIMLTPTIPDQSANVGTTIVSNSGPINVSGGAGDNGGAAGAVALIGYDTVTNSGSITAAGGAGKTKGGAGARISLTGIVVPAGNPQGVFLHTTNGNLANSGVIDVTGGTGTTVVPCITGGDGGFVTMDAGNQTTNSASIFAGGGNGTANGGNGGSIALLSHGGVYSLNTGIFSVSRGTGGTAKDGIFTIDGN